jgi:hypothetical protein
MEFPVSFNISDYGGTELSIQALDSRDVAFLANEELFVPHQVRAVLKLSSSALTEFTVSAEAAESYDLIVLRNGTNALMNFTYDNITLTPACLHGEDGAPLANSEGCSVQIGYLKEETDATKFYVGAKVVVGELTVLHKSNEASDAYLDPAAVPLAVMEINTIDRGENGELSYPLYLKSASHVRARTPNFFVGGSEPDLDAPYGNALQFNETGIAQTSLAKALVVTTYNSPLVGTSCWQSKRRVSYAKPWCCLLS